MPPPVDHRAIGAAAEGRACRMLLLRGWRICARNWIGGGGELDIVASRWRTLLIVEVRQRVTGAAAVASVDRAKLDRTVAAARALVRSHGLERYRLRFDVIGFPPDGRAVWRCDILQIGQPGH
jgi:Holliday junction resolvase-like predicted endonuclease